MPQEEVVTVRNTTKSQHSTDFLILSARESRSISHVSQLKIRVLVGPCHDVNQRTIIDHLVSIMRRRLPLKYVISKQKPNIKVLSEPKRIIQIRVQV